MQNEQNIIFTKNMELERKDNLISGNEHKMKIITIEAQVQSKTKNLNHNNGKEEGLISMQQNGLATLQSEQ